MLGGYEEENGDERLGIIESFYSVFALEDIPFLQKQETELAEIINYLGTGDLPISDKSARKIVMIADQFALDDNVHCHFYSPKSRYRKRRLTPIKQLCIPLSLKLDILKLYDEQSSSHKSPKALFETLSQKYFWFNLYSDTQLYCKQCRGCLMVKKRTHPNKTPLHSFESCEFWDKILADISGQFKTDSLGNRYCIMVTERLSKYAILISLKSVSAEAMASALYTHVFTKHGVRNTILMDRGSAFRSALVKAIDDIFKVKQGFSMTARPSTLSQVN